MFDKKNILGVGITNASKQEILEYVIKGLQKSAEKYYIVTPNPEILVLAHKNPEFKKILNKAKLASADGIGVMLAGKILEKQLKERITGVDLLEDLCREVSEKPITVGFLGGGPKIAESAAECLRQKYSGLKVVFIGQEWSDEFFARQPRVSDDARLQNSQNQPLNSASLSKIRQQSKHQPNFNSSESRLPRTDILFVAFGAPKQEIWMSDNLNKIPVRVAIGVGGAFDYVSGKTPRAPSFIRNIGLEWLFRLVVQPWRIKRQLALLEFIWLVVKEKLKRN